MRTTDQGRIDNQRAMVDQGDDGKPAERCGQSGRGMTRGTVKIRGQWQSRGTMENQRTKTDHGGWETRGTMANRSCCFFFVCFLFVFFFNYTHTRLRHCSCRKPFSFGRTLEIKITLNDQRKRKGKASCDSRAIKPYGACWLFSVSIIH